MDSHPIRTAVLLHATLLIVAALSCLTGAAPGRAAVTCYDEIAYPSVVKIESTPDGVRLILGGKFASKSETHRVVQQSKTGVWSVAAPVRCSGNACAPDEGSCGKRLPEIRISPELLRQARPSWGDRTPEGIEQTVGGCMESQGFLWFGIHFYDGEGFTGVGGFGRMNLQTDDVEVRRPPPVLQYSVDRVLHDRTTLYVATGAHHECLGDPPVAGLLAYDWQTNAIAEIPTCGRVIHDVQRVGEEIWVATDMGLSIGTPADAAAPLPERRSWKHYAPEPDRPEVMRETSCGELYREILASPLELDQTSDYRDTNEQLLGTYAVATAPSSPALRNADLSGRSMPGARFEGADMRGAKLGRADLRGARLAGAQLSGADLSGADLRGADLSKATLVGANLSETDLRQTRMLDVDASEANFRDARLLETDLQGVVLRGAHLTFSSTAQIEQSQLDTACGDAATEVPKSMEPPPLCANRGAGPEALAQIVAAHQQWLESNGKEGTRADLRGPVLARRRIDLSRAVLRGALLRRAQLSGANLAGAELKGADLRGAALAGTRFQQVNLSETQLSPAGLDGIDFSNAVLTGMNLKGARLDGANLSSAKLKHVDLEGAALRGVDLSGAILSGANLRRADLSGANLTRANLEAAALTGAVLVGANFSYAKLSGAELTDLDLAGLNLANADLSKAQLLRVTLRGANLAYAQLSRSDLRDADLRDAVLIHARLESADLTGASLRGANLQDAALAAALLEKTRLEGANLEGVWGLNARQLTGACGDANTHLPQGAGRVPPCEEP